MEKYILTEKECVDKGGHVYDYTYGSTGIIPTKDSPQFQICKYCGHKQIGYYPPMVWEDVDADQKD